MRYSRFFPLTLLKPLKTTYDSHPGKSCNTGFFSGFSFAPTTLHSKNVKIQPPNKTARPALRGGVEGRVAL